MPFGPRILPLSLALACLVAAPGCHLLLPEVSQQPILHNPFPQLSRVAVAPFFNQSDESTVDGRQFAMAYYAELQDVPGFEVVPLGVVEAAIIDHAIDLSGPGEARRLAQVLGVDAVVVGSVTDYSPYYPPRCGMRVDWYAANPGFHAIPAGYGLPWGTREEEYIPEELVFEAEMELARAQLATQSPDCSGACEALIAPPDFSAPIEATPIPSTIPAPPSSPDAPPEEPADDPGEHAETPIEDSVEESMEEAAPAAPAPGAEGDVAKSADDDQAVTDDRSANKGGWRTQRRALKPAIDSGAGGPTTAPLDATGGIDPTGMTPHDWPDARGFTPPGPCATRPVCVPNLGPVMTHTRIYRGHDPDFTAALASYVSFRDDARFGGWQSYLERTDDFIRFCAHLHLAEMLTARGGGGETRVVHRWSESR